MEDTAFDWNKLKQNSEKAGFREGIEEGRISNFQKSFDEGYKSGFQNGFELGKYKAHLKIKENNLEPTRRGNCILCKDASLLIKSNKEKEKLQWDSTEKILT